jgi:hypothetical protein
MALKDWIKEYSEGGKSFIYKTKEGDLQLVGRSFTDVKDWEVIVVKPYEDLITPVFKKIVKTKDQALRVAENFMKKH